MQIEKDSQEPVIEDQEEEEDEKLERGMKLSQQCFSQLTLPTLERTLCSSADKSFNSTYICDICDSSYGCLNCLKSHYESLHVSDLPIIHYKCRNSPNCPKGLFCPVCEMIFENRYEKNLYQSRFALK